MKPTRTWTAITATVLATGLVSPVWAQQEPSHPRVPAELLAHGIDRVYDVDDPMSSPDADLQGDRAAREFRDSVEVAVDQQQAERLWRRHGAPGAPPVLAAHHVLAAVRIDHSVSCWRRSFDAAWDLGTAVDLVFPTEPTSACDEAHGPGGPVMHDVYVIDLDVSHVSPEAGVVRVSAAFGGPLRYRAETAVDLPVAPRLPRTGTPLAWLALAALTALAVGAAILAPVRPAAHPY